MIVSNIVRLQAELTHVMCENGTCGAQMLLRKKYFTDAHWSYITYIPISSGVIWYHINIVVQHICTSKLYIYWHKTTTLPITWHLLFDPSDLRLRPSDSFTNFETFSKSWPSHRVPFTATTSSPSMINMPSAWNRFLGLAKEQATIIETHK